MISYTLGKEYDAAQSLPEKIYKAIQSSPDIIVFAFSGYKGSGKSHYANKLADNIDIYLSEEDYWINRVISFADPLKSAVSDLFDIPTNHFYESKFKDTIVPKYNKTPRQLLQWFGTEIMQTEFARFLGYSDRLLWVNKCIYKEVEYMVDTDESYKNIIIIDDLRFAHEQAALIKYFGRKSISFIRVINTTIPPYTPEEKAALHVSETEHESLEVDYTINNDMTSIDHSFLTNIAKSLYNTIE